MRKRIITGASALYLQGVIGYKPSKLNIEMVYGTNSSKVSDEYVVYTQNQSTIDIGVESFDDKFDIYSKERLFVEYEKISLENTIKAEGLRNLTKEVNPQLVADIYQKIKKKRRNINHERIESFINFNVIQVKEALLNNEFDKTVVIREYIMALLVKKLVPCSLIKGGSAVELYIDFKRSTQDIDAHLDKTSIESLLEILTNRNNAIYFKPLNLEQLKEDLYVKNKIITELILVPYSKSNVINNVLWMNPTAKTRIQIKLNINTTYSDDELRNMISEFNITQTNLKTIKNAYCLIFTREMLIAEKYKALINGNENATRTKDLIDLVNLYNESVDLNKIAKWLFRKWKNSRVSLEQSQALEFINAHKDIELTKIKENWNDACTMYETNVDYNEAIGVYKNISKWLLENIKM